MLQDPFPIGSGESMLMVKKKKKNGGGTGSTDYHGGGGGKGDFYKVFKLKK